MSQDLFDESQKPMDHEAYTTSVLHGETSKLCPICSNEAGRHIHYGGHGCSSCRVFFRRSVQNKAFEKFVCKDPESSLDHCAIDSKSWKSCKFCRYQKCLNSGMKTILVLNEEYRKIRHEKRAAKHPLSEQPQSTMSICPQPDNIFTEDDNLYLLNQRKDMQYQLCQEMTTFYSMNTNIFKNMLSVIYYGTNMPYTNFQNITEAANRCIGNYFIKSSDMDGIPISDQSRLVHNNASLVKCMFQSIALGNRGSLLIFKKIVQNAISECDDHRLITLKEVFQEFTGPIHLPYNVASAALHYKQVYSSPWTPNIELERRHEELTQKICQWPMENSGNSIKVDDVMVTCLSRCLMFNTNFITLKDPKRVNSIQLQYLKLLQRYLKSKHDISYANIWYNSLMIGSFAREIMEICTKRLPV